MKIVNLSGSPRENVGKADAKILRNKGLVPCVIYGGESQVHFFLDERQFTDVVFTPEVCFVKMEVEGKTYDVILQDIQYHPVSDRILHADFLEIHDEKQIKMMIPVFHYGSSVGVIKGGHMYQLIRKLVVRALPNNMPTEIKLDITDLDIGDSIKVKDITIKDAVILNQQHEAVIQVKTARLLIEEETEVEEGEEGEGEEGEGEGEGEKSEGKGGDAAKDKKEKE